MDNIYQKINLKFVRLAEEFMKFWCTEYTEQLPFLKFTIIVHEKIKVTVF